MKEKTSKLTDLLALLLLAVFAVCVLFVLLTGAKVYRNLVRSGGTRFERRTAVQYVTTRVRQAESVSVAEFEGCDALVIPEEIGGKTYLTRVYVYDGYIRELFCAETANLSPEDGEKILPAESLEFDVEDGILSVSIDSRQVLLNLPSREEDAP